MRLHPSFLLLPLVAAFVTGCASHKSKFVHTSPLVGRWSTGSQLSQLGPSVTKLTLRPDGTFEMKSRSIALWGSDRGQYRVEGDKLIFQGKRKTTTARYRFDGSELVVTEGASDVFTYRRIGDVE